MDSLLASYGSDQDSDDEEPLILPPASSTPLNFPAKPAFFTSLPPPQFASPSFQSLNSQKRANSLSSKIPLFASLPSPKLPPLSPLPAPSAPALSEKLIAVHNQRLNDSEEEIRVSDRVALASAPPGQRESRRSPLFRSLPPPRSAGLSSLVTSLAPSEAQPAGDAPKRVVKFTPSVNKALLDNSEEDDEPRIKRRTSESVAALSGKGSGLAAILPRPKNLGATLGGGTTGGGRRAALETFSLAPVSETRSVETAPSRGNSSSSVHVNSAVGTGENHGHVAEEGKTGYSLGHNQHSNVSTTENVETLVGQTGYSLGHNHLSNVSTPQNVETIVGEEYLGLPYHQNQGLPVEGASGVDSSCPANIGKITPFNADDALASIMMKEKRRGNKDEPPSVIEVRQADLTASKIREDQLRTTGIAFGPAYKPVSSNKDKPSKIHRRKHQIGSLYYDMKQKEIELLERRSKGSLTKSETQAKYGW